MHRVLINKLNYFHKFWLAFVCGALIGMSVNAADSEYRFVIKKGDTLSLYFNKLGLNKQLLSSILSSNIKNKMLNNLSIGHTLTIGLDKNKQLESVSYNINSDSSIEVSNSGGRFVTNIKKRQGNNSINISTITINKSLSYDAKKLNIKPKTVNTLVRVFSWKINFKKDLRKGDKFIIVGNNSGTPLALIFKSRSKSIALFSYTDKYGNVDYYDKSGLSVRSSFLAAPLKYDRISSKFKKSRYHPILKTWRPHRAVDYTAKKGTPVYSTADGIVKYAKNSQSLGNVVYIQHGNDHLTVYAHLSKFAKGLKPKARIVKGQTIGFVGSTGLSTGPHLHYELRYKGERKDPLKYNIEEQKTIDSFNLALFKQRAKIILNSL